MSTTRVVFAYPLLFRIVPVVACLACVAYVTVGGGAGGSRTPFFGVAAVTLVMAVVFRDRIEVHADEITVVRLWASRRYPRENVLAVNWEHGSKVTLDFRDGTHASLPSIRESEARVAGAIHSWLAEGRKT